MAQGGSGRPRSERARGGRACDLHRHPALRTSRHRAGTGRSGRLVRRHQPADRRCAPAGHDAARAVDARDVHARAQLGCQSRDADRGGARRHRDPDGRRRGNRRPDARAVPDHHSGRRFRRGVRGLVADDAAVQARTRFRRAGQRSRDLVSLPARDAERGAEDQADQRLSVRRGDLWRPARRPDTRRNEARGLPRTRRHAGGAILRFHRCRGRPPDCGDHREPGQQDPVRCRAGDLRGDATCHGRAHCDGPPIRRPCR